MDENSRELYELVSQNGKEVLINQSLYHSVKRNWGCSVLNMNRGKIAVVIGVHKTVKEAIHIACKDRRTYIHFKDLSPLVDTEEILKNKIKKCKFNPKELLL